MTRRKTFGGRPFSFVHDCTVIEPRKHHQSDGPRPFWIVFCSSANWSSPDHVDFQNSVDVRMTDSGVEASPTILIKRFAELR